MALDSDTRQLRTEVAKSALTVEEYIAMTRIAESKGLTQSSYIRMLIKADISRESREGPK